MYFIKIIFLFFSHYHQNQYISKYHHKNITIKFPNKMPIQKKSYHLKNIIIINNKITKIKNKIYI